MSQVGPVVSDGAGLLFVCSEAKADLGGDDAMIRADSDKRVESSAVFSAVMPFFVDDQIVELCFSTIW